MFGSGKGKFRAYFFVGCTITGFTAAPLAGVVLAGVLLAGVVVAGFFTAVLTVVAFLGAFVFTDAVLTTGFLVPVVFAGMALPL